MNANKKNMKRVISAGWIVMLSMVSVIALAQSKDTDQRMTRDIEVAENILGTLLKQESGRRGFFPSEVKGTYVPGYGVTFRMPVGWMGRFVISGVPDIETIDVRPAVPGSYSYSYSYSRSEDEARQEEMKAKTEEKKARQEEQKARETERKVKREMDQMKTTRTEGRKEMDDSVNMRMRERFMDVARNFLADYGDVVSGLKADEKIIITNRADNFEPDFDMIWINGRESSRPMLSVEARRGDIDQLKQGKISRTEFMNHLKVVNAEKTEALDPDLEVFSSLFGRLYREDLSQTYYAQGSIRYERLKDFGVMYYMKVYSSLETDDGYSMPTVSQRGLSQAERDKRVKELYPKFESELKENIVEYGRTLRSLKDDEQLVFNVKLTKCEGCGIPATLELSIKSIALKDYSAGKASKEATVAKISLKKSGAQ